MPELWTNNGPKWPYLGNFCPISVTGLNDAYARKGLDSAVPKHEVASCLAVN